MAQAVDFEKVQLSRTVPQASSGSDVFHIGGSEPLRALLFFGKRRDDELVRYYTNVGVRDFPRRPDGRRPRVVR